jgi:hypothetical protein
MPAATRRAVHNATNLLTATPDEAAILIATALGSAMDLLRLAAACRRFALKYIAAPLPPLAASGSGAAAAAAAAAAAETWSITEEVARRWIAACTGQERSWVPRRGRESWLGLMWEVEVLRRRGAVFGRSHESVTLSEGGSIATRSGGRDTWLPAASKAMMRAGHHYAQFTVVNDSAQHPGLLWRLFRPQIGVLRPGWDVEGGRDAQYVDGHCFYDTHSGRRCPGRPGRQDWEGMLDAREGDRIGMLLDLDEGSMTVYKNDKRLGVMATGLSGKYSWAVALCVPGDSARIDPAALPF